MADTNTPAETPATPAETPPVDNTEGAGNEGNSTETPKAPAEASVNELSEETRKKYEGKSADDLISEVEKWKALSRKNETRAEENNTSVSGLQTELETVRATAEKAEKELAELKAEKAALELSALRNSELLKAGLDPAEDGDLITATDADGVKKQIARLAARIGSTKPAEKQKNVIAGAGAAKETGPAPLSERMRAHLTR